MSSTYGDVVDWDVSRVTNMSGLFKDSFFNEGIGSWNTSAVTDMSYMFYNARSFNQPIGTWDTSAVTDMSYMFYTTPSPSTNRSEPGTPRP